MSALAETQATDREHALDRLTIERCMNDRQRRLRFPAPVERAYETYRREYRARVMASTIVPSLLIYNLYLIVDYLLLPATFDIALLCHLLVVTPWLLVAGLVVRQRPGLWLRECLSASMPLAMAAQLLFIFYLNREVGTAEHYQYAVSGILTYANVNQRPPFRFALASTLILIAGYCSVLLAAQIAFPAFFIGMALMSGVGYVSLVANYRMERDTRYAFLRRIHDRLENEISAHAATHDALTGLANRHEFDRQSALLYADRRHARTSLGVLMLDVDDFKAYNDYYGHPAGDACLRCVAGEISAQLRSDRDLAIRYGGEEFLILLFDATLAETTVMAERLRRAIETFGIPHAPTGSHVSVSIGAAAGVIAEHPLDTLVAQADAALYDAKHGGKNRVSPSVMVDAASTPRPAVARY
ncbi:diguanylate cyclase [Salinisphaera sp. T5B8]